MFNIGSVVAKVQADTTNFQKGIGEVSGSANKLGGLMTKLGVIIGGAFAVSKIIDFGKQSSKVAMDFERSMISLEIISGKFGVSADKAKISAESLGKELRIGVGASAESLQNLLKSGLNLDQSIDLMKRFTNEAITGKSANIDLATAVQNLSFAYATGNSALGNMSGMSENWSDIIDKGRLALEKEGVAVKDITDDMAKYRGTIDLTNLTMGSAERFHGTLIDKQAELGIKVYELKLKIGNMLNPVLAVLVDKISIGVDKFSNFIDVIKQSGQEGGFLNDVFKEMGRVWNEVMIFLEPLIAWFISSVIPKLQSLWAEIMYFINAVVPPLIAIIKFLVVEVIMYYVGILVDFWKKNWEHISAILKGIWDVNVGIIKLALAIIMGIITTVLALLTGNWKGAWDNIKHYAGNAWEAIKQIFSGALSYVKGWGGWIFDALTEPFRRAWDKVKETVENIKNALDFTQRHSPSVIDIIQKGVRLANDSLDDLKVGIEPIDTTRFALSGTSGNSMVVNVSLDGAMISDEYGARQMAERMGDLIIGRLKGNVRF